MSPPMRLSTHRTVLADRQAFTLKSPVTSSIEHEDCSNGTDIAKPSIDENDSRVDTTVSGQVNRVVHAVRIDGMNMNQLEREFK